MHPGKSASWSTVSDRALISMRRGRSCKSVVIPQNCRLDFVRLYVQDDRQMLARTRIEDRQMSFGEFGVEVQAECLLILRDGVAATHGFKYYQNPGPRGRSAPMNLFKLRYLRGSCACCSDVLVAGRTATWRVLTESSGMSCSTGRYLKGDYIRK